MGLNLRFSPLEWNGTTKTLDLTLVNKVESVMSIAKTCSAITGAIHSVNISQTMTRASTTNTIEVLKVTLTSDVKNGNWANAICGKIDYQTSGQVTGFAGVICAELNMGGLTLAGGSYACFEAELEIANNCLLSGVNTPVAFLTGNAWGTDIAEWRGEGVIFNFTGVGAATSHKIFQANTAGAATHALRIMIDGVYYYMMLTDTDA